MSELSICSAQISGTAGTKADRQAARLQKVCQDVEALFFSQMLREMRASVPEGGLLPKGHGEALFQEMLDGEYARLVGHGSNAGLAAMLYRELAPKSAGEKKSQPQGFFSSQG